MPLTLADISALSRLLDEAFELDAAARAAWLDALPESERRMAPRLIELLAVHDSGIEPGLFSCGPRLGQDVSAMTDETAHAGAAVGPYRLIREIGRGGMGAVWLAERADGAFRRTVALKLPRLAWGSGLIERMSRERDIIARLEHPNIARLYDAGVDPHGRPYLAIEYVDGQPIDRYCATHAVALRDRLRLVLQVARALAYAHGRLVVHRDLKPSNVLVTADGQTHLLDFGIAKLLQDGGRLDETLTQEYGNPLTPHFASPEQVLGGAITVMSDVYSLGVLLYELLAGCLPYTLKRKTLAELEEAILEGETPLASSRTTDPIARRALRGELDAILAKAMRREPAQRYQSGDAMADDIERYLAGERVLAQPDSAWYRVRTALRRHRIGFSAAGAIGVALLLGAGVSLWQAGRANDAAERARIVKDFVVDVFRVNARGNPDNAELRQLPAERLLERGALQIETRFNQQPAMQAELYGVVGEIFADMSSPRLAEHYVRKQAVALEAMGAGADQRAGAMTLIARALADQGRLPEANAAARVAIATARGWPVLEADARMVLADVLIEQSHDDEAEQELNRASTDLKSHGQESSIQSARVLAKRGFLLMYRDRFDMALPLYDRAIEEAIRIEGPLSPLASTARLQLARRYRDLGRIDDAKPHITTALAAMRARGGIDEIRAATAEGHTTSHMFVTFVRSRRGLSFDETRATLDRLKAHLIRMGTLVPASNLARIDTDLGLMYLSWGDIERSYQILGPALVALRATEPGPRWKRVTASLLGGAAMRKGEHAQADTLLREAMTLSPRFKRGASHPEFVDMARNLWMQGQFDEAEAVLDSINPPAGQDSAASASFDEVLMARVQVKLDRGDPASALLLLAEAKGDVDGDVFGDRRLLRGAALCALGQTREGLPLMDTHAALAAEGHSAHHPELARWRALTGLCALHAGNRQRASEMFELARAAFTGQPGVSPYYKAPQLRLAAKLGRTPAASR